MSAGDARILVLPWWTHWRRQTMAVATASRRTRILPALKTGGQWAAPPWFMPHLPFVLSKLCTRLSTLIKNETAFVSAAAHAAGSEPSPRLIKKRKKSQKPLFRARLFCTLYARVGPTQTQNNWRRLLLLVEHRALSLFAPIFAHRWPPESWWNKVHLWCCEFHALVSGDVN